MNFSDIVLAKEHKNMKINFYAQFAIALSIIVA
jgi:hypothetical protein